MESSMGQMSNQKEREGHAVKLAMTVMHAHGGLNLYSIFSKEHPTYIRMQSWLEIKNVGHFCCVIETYNQSAFSIQK